MDLNSFLVSYVPLHRRLVERTPLVGSAEQGGTAGPAQRQRGLDAGDPRPWPRLRCERDFWRIASSHLRSHFPEMYPQSQLKRRVRTLEPDFRALQRAFGGALSDPSAVYHLLDTTLVPAVVLSRISSQVRP
jgi:hypothetical protein